MSQARNIVQVGEPAPSEHTHFGACLAQALSQIKISSLESLCMEVTPSSDQIRTISRHTLAYVLCSISELFRHYDFDPLDLLISWRALSFLAIAGRQSARSKFFFSWSAMRVMRETQST
jgi:hypothetical protein